jgi:hypothetical protein
MKVKVFQPNHNGKIEFTRAELERLLNEIYNDGYREGEAAGQKHSWTWTSPYITNHTYRTTASDTTNDKGIDKLTCSCDSAKDKGITEIVPTFAETKKVPSYTVSIGREDVDKLTQTINSLIAGNKPNDVFTNLAKELNF